MTVLTIETPEVFEPLLHPSRYKAAYGGRGSGKSHFFAELLIERCLLGKVDAVCVREVQRSLDQSVKKLLELKIEELGVSDRFVVQDAVIKTPCGGRIIFQGMQNHTADSIKSLEGYDIAWVEEAQSLSQKSLDLLRPTIRKTGSEIWFSWNPDQPTDPIDLFFRSEDGDGNEMVPPDTILVRANYTDNPWFPEVLRAEMEYDRSRDPDKYAHVWLGEYNLNSEARVFSNWRVEEFEAPEDAIFRFGADWGYAQDPTVLIRCFLQGKKLFIDYEAYKVGCDIDFTPDLFFTVPEAQKWPIVADSSRPETIAYMKRHGFDKITHAVKGKGSVEDGIEYLKSYDIIVHPRCVHAIDELIAYKWKVDDKTGAILPILEDKHNHVIDALRYACEGARRASPPPVRKINRRKVVEVSKKGTKGHGWLGR